MPYAKYVWQLTVCDFQELTKTLNELEQQGHEIFQILNVPNGMFVIHRKTTRNNVSEFLPRE